LFGSLRDEKSEALHYEKALVIARKLKDINLEGKILREFGNIYRYSSISEQRKIGVQYLQLALQIAQTTQNKELEAEIFRDLEYPFFDFRTPHQYFEIASIILNLAQKFKQPQLEAKIIYEMGETYHHLKKYAQAEEYYQKSLNLAQAIKKRELERDIFNSIGMMNESGLKNKSKAAEAYQKMELVDWELSKKVKCESDPIYALGKAYERMNNYTKAAEYATQALRIERKTNAECHLRQLSFLIKVTAYTTRNPQKAAASVQETLQIIQPLKTRSDELNSTISVMLSFHKEWAEAKVNGGKEAEGIQLYQQALSIAQAIDEKEETFGLFLKIGEVYIATNNFTAALNTYQQALQKSRASNNQPMEAQIFAELDNMYSAQGEDKKAEHMYQNALKILKLLPKDDKFAYLLYTLSGTYLDQDNYQKGISFAEQALSIFQGQSGSSSDLFKMLTLGNLAGAYEKLGDYARSRQYLEQSIIEARKVNLRIFENIGFLMQGMIAIRQNRPQQAIQYSQQAIEVLKERSNINDTFMSIFASGFEEVLTSAALMFQSEGYLEMGRYPEALKAVQSALKTLKDEPLLGSRLPADSRDFFEQQLHAQMGNIHYQAGSLELSLQSYQTAISMESQQADNTTPILFGLGRIYRDQNQPSLAIAYYKQAVQEIEQVRSKNRKLSQSLQASFLESLIGFSNFKVSDVHRQLADLLLSQGRILEAQQVLELLKIQELKDFTRSARAGGQPSSITLSPTEAKILEQHGSLITLGKELETCQKTNCATKTQLLETRRALTEQFNQAIAAETSSLQQRPADDKAFLDPRNQFGTTAQQIIKAQPGTVLVYPLVLENKLWLLMAAEGGILKKFEVPVTQKQLGETVLKFRQLLQSSTSDITQVQATGQQLYSWLIKPIESELKVNQIKHLVFAPDRVTRYIPMSALHDGKQYLIENYTVSNILSANLTRVGDTSPLNAQQTSVLALGLSQSVADLPPLPSVPGEVDGIVRQSTGDPRGIYPGKEFLDKNFTFASLEGNLFGHQILHIATHGKFEPGRPDASYLVLGDGQKLPIPKIETIQDLGDVKLVTLSACETALGGAGQDGTEIAGLSYYFLAKGAQAVMASLWLVNDDSTSQLMQNFYTNLSQPKGDKTTKAEALQQAQIALLRGQSGTTKQQRGSIQVQPIAGTKSNPSSNNLQHPYYWAPFILIGNGL
jgi:CHAT domain-containing protein